MEDVDAKVKEWIQNNPYEFTIDGKNGKPFDLEGEDENNLRFRRKILERCKQYKDAPAKYLEEMLKTLPDTMKWYFNILQIVLMTGVLSFLVALSILAITKFLEWVQNLNVIVDSFTSTMTLNNYIEFASGLVQWLLPTSIAALILFLALRENKTAQSSWLSYIIQHKFKIVHNLEELKIEMFYISKEMERQKTSEPHK